MGFVFKRDDEKALEAGKGGGISTGIHKVKVLACYLYQTEKGNNVIDIELETESGAKGTIFNMCIDEKWTSGAENFDYPRWQELVVCADMKTGATAPVKRKTKKNGADVEIDSVVFTELVNKQLTMAIQVEKDWYNNKEVAKRNLYSTFLVDGCTIAEKQAGSPAIKSVELAKTLKDYETKAYKANKNGSITGDTPPSEPAAQEQTQIPDNASLL